MIPGTTTSHGQTGSFFQNTTSCSMNYTDLIEKTYTSKDREPAARTKDTFISSNMATK